MQIHSRREFLPANLTVQTKYEWEQKAKGKQMDKVLELELSDYQPSSACSGPTESVIM